MNQNQTCYKWKNKPTTVEYVPPKSSCSENPNIFNYQFGLIDREDGVGEKLVFCEEVKIFVAFKST